MPERYWNAAEWEDGDRAKKLVNRRFESEGRHGELVERYGAYAYPLDVPGDPRRWVCHWVYGA